MIKTYHNRYNYNQYIRANLINENLFGICIALDNKTRYSLKKESYYNSIEKEKKDFILEHSSSLFSSLSNIRSNLFNIGSRKLLSMLKKINNNESNIFLHLYRLEDLKYRAYKEDSRFRIRKYPYCIQNLRKLSELNNINIYLNKYDNLDLFEYIVEYKGYKFSYTLPYIRDFIEKFDNRENNRYNKVHITQFHKLFDLIYDEFGLYLNYK